MLMNTSKYTWVYLYKRGKPEEASEMAEPISAAYMHWPHSTFTLSTQLTILTMLRAGVRGVRGPPQISRQCGGGRRSNPAI